MGCSITNLFIRDFTNEYLKVYEKILDIQDHNYQESLKNELEVLYKRELNAIHYLRNNDDDLKLIRTYIAARVALMQFMKDLSLSNDIKSEDDSDIILRDDLPEDDDNILIVDDKIPTVMLLSNDDINKIIGEV